MHQFDQLFVETVLFEFEIWIRIRIQRQLCMNKLEIGNKSDINDYIHFTIADSLVLMRFITESFVVPILVQKTYFYSIIN
jgi:hypothetical protein